MDDLEAAHALRLRALKAAPDAFGARYEAELEVTVEERQRRTLELLAEQRREVLLAEVRGKPVGMCFVHFLADEPACADIGGMWVDEEYQARGIGRRLLGEAESWSLARGASDFVLWVTKGNATAQALFESAGYRLTGVQETHPTRLWLTVLELRKHAALQA